MAAKITPSFLLKGIDPNVLLARYQAGAFTKIQKKKSKIKINANVSILAPIYGSTNQSPIFCVKDRNNCNIVVVTTGHADYEIFTKSGGILSTGGRCDHCKDDFDSIAIGYPIGYQENSILLNSDPDPQNGRYRVIHTFWVEGKFCSFECALGYVRLILSKPADYRDTTIRDSERLLKFLYKLMHPKGGILRPAQDPRLLKSNGGSLTKEQWIDNRHIYIRTDRILMIPAKVEYVQQNFLNPVTPIDYNQDTTATSSSTSSTTTTTNFITY